ncbi:GIY-YIG nuclease family protein [Priestia megaterium]|uniref:GIY-YIG nuclease family protein n=1 Tax=Priestia megaterium TaxID=1404 RepID=UPI0039DF2B75
MKIAKCILYEKTQTKRIVNPYNSKSYHHPSFCKVQKEVELRYEDYLSNEIKKLEKEHRDNSWIPGLYMLYSSLKDYPHSPIYIGKSRKVYERVLRHIRGGDRATSSYYIQLVRIYFSKSFNDLNDIERNYIYKYRPLLNITFNRVFQSKRMLFMDYD